MSMQFFKKRTTEARTMIHWNASINHFTSEILDLLANFGDSGVIVMHFIVFALIGRFQVT